MTVYGVLVNNKYPERLPPPRWIARLLRWIGGRR
jgi:hypothetical protein